MMQANRACSLWGVILVLLTSGGAILSINVTPLAPLHCRQRKYEEVEVACGTRFPQFCTGPPPALHHQVSA